ncbi:MAG TPA: hypothetical protein VI112_06390 [Bacteroidia bacterium]
MRCRAFYLLLCAGALLCSPVFAQQKTIKVKKKEHNQPVPQLDTLKRPSHYYRWYTSPDLFYGYRYMDMKGLSAVIFSNGNSFPGKNVIYGSNFKYRIDLSRSASASVAVFLFSRLDPQKVCDSDSSFYLLSGYNFHLLNVGFYLTHSRRIGFLLYPGFEYGWLTLERRTDHALITRYRDPFFDLQLAGEVKTGFSIRKSIITVGVKGGYLHDIGNPDWRLISGNSAPLPGTKANAWYYHFVLGFDF